MENEYSKFSSFCHFSMRCHVRCHINWAQDFHLMSNLNIFFWLNTENNADPYIINPPYLSRPKNIINELWGTLFSWFGSILFLLHQCKCHWWQLTTCSGPYIYVKTKGHVYMRIKKTSTKLSRTSDSSLG